MTPRFALVDCNNFYCSCERVFAPRLIGVPVVILSNNDGCVIARSEEAKRLGIKMGAPAFKNEAMFRRNGVQVLSSNYALYGDMSARVINTLRTVVQHMEAYSIDEAFLSLEDRQCIASSSGAPANQRASARKSVERSARFARKSCIGRTRSSSAGIAASARERRLSACAG